MEGIYANVEHDKTDENPQTIQTGPESSPRRFYRPVALFLGLLSVLLLAGIITLSIFYLASVHRSSAELSATKANLTEHLQAKDQQLSSLTEQKDLLNVSLTDMRKELKRLQSLSKQKKTCSAGWKRFECSCYLFSEQKNSWEGSRQDCRNRDSDLVVIESSGEQEFVSNNIKDWAWIGLSDRENENIWKWTDGTPLTQGYWWSGQPDNGGGDPQWGEEDCVHLENHRGKEANWNDVRCDKSLLWICEK
ncbi:CD209 antigen-like protein C [Cheilinus undulatus]|uniref:CD209 antigen-like protein C n=1 Tax=Cheilinus undulatus TaxID=241271 RepID=UPI001BD50962|nr:CD209 antigen-like protein C [Cheilinus undulatus]XP_041662857.1 CD209 antigen-like protein C [Cheilinus undulatus]